MPVMTNSQSEEFPNLQAKAMVQTAAEMYGAGFS